MEEAIVASGMTFGPFPGRCFNVEKCSSYQKMKGVKMVEFLLLKLGEPASVWLVEAKSSSPQQKNAEQYSSYINDIRDKFINGLSLGMPA